MKCSDGRLYHGVVAEKAIAAWLWRLSQQWSREKGRLKKEAQRTKKPVVYPEFDQWISLECPEALPYLSLRQTTPVPEDMTPLSPGHDPPVPRETPSKRSEVKGSKDLNHRFPGVVSTTAPPDRTAAVGNLPPNPDALGRILDECKRAKVEDVTEDNAVIARWIRNGATPGQVVLALVEAREQGSCPFPEVLRIGYVDKILVRIVEQDLKAREANEATLARTQQQTEEQRAWIDKTLPPDQPIPEAAAKFVKHRPLEP
jgi:hypothetical protein